MDSTEPKSPTTVSFERDTTLRWSCREGDFILWARLKGGFMGREWGIADVWKLRDGDWVTITNRVQDLPFYIQLHPSEVEGNYAHWMMKKLKQGYKPMFSMDAANIWRVRAGDRLVWVGKERPGMRSSDGVLVLLEMNENAFALGDSTNDQENMFELFGQFTGQEKSEESLRMCHAGIEAVKVLGTPREFSPEWKLGW